MSCSETVPVDKMKVFDKTGKKRPALDIYWIDKIDFIKYKPLESVDQASVEEWADRLAFIEEDLHRLLCQPHHKFWSQMIFDGSLHLCLDSYLSCAPRCFDVMVDIPEQYQDSLKRVHKLVFMIYLRIATHKESKEHYITADVFGEILYQNFLFDVPKLMDLCVLYGTGNGKLLSKMINNVFTQQPKYMDDLKTAIPTIFEVFDNISEKCGVVSYNTTISENIRGQNSILEMSATDIKDILHYLADVAQSILAFVEIYPPAAQVLQQAGFINRLAMLYEGVVPQLKRALKEKHWQDQQLKEYIKKRLTFAKSCLINVCHSLINSTCIQQILENSDNKEIVEEKSKDFLEAIESVLAEKLFLADLDKCFSIEADLQLLEQTDKDKKLDANRVQFILAGVRDARTNTGKERKTSITNHIAYNEEKSSDKEMKLEGAVGGVEETPIGAVGGVHTDVMYQSDNYLQDYAGVAMPTDIEISSLISSIQDLFPDLGEGFIEACLEEFNYNPSEVIDKILEDNLPSSLKALDHNMTRNIKPKESSLLSQRNNIFDNDQFDIFNTTGFDKSKVHKGKKKEEADVETVLLDKSHVNDLKEMYTELGYTYDNEYDDEYDDTYDATNIGATDADSADELADGRAFTVPRILQQIDRKITKAKEPEERREEIVPKDTGPVRDEFIQNPAVLREKREQRYQQRQQEKGNKSRQENVKGKPKGHGQDSNTVRARRHKEANKSQRANHNRKAMASKKMAKGM